VKPEADLGQGHPAVSVKNPQVCAGGWVALSPVQPALFMTINPSCCYSAGRSGRLVKEIEN
jgi:hypothetical protein